MKIERKIENVQTTHKEFPFPAACWKDNKLNRAIFMGNRKCHKIDYHNESKGCLPFDDMIENMTTEEYRTTLFHYYEITSPENLPSKPRYIEREMTRNSSEIYNLSKYAIVKKTLIELQSGIPDDFEELPKIIDPDIILQQYGKTNKRQREMLKKKKETLLIHIENCLQRRLYFRKQCLKDCSLVIDTRSHDKQIFILQILRAKTITDLVVLSR